MMGRVILVAVLVGWVAVSWAIRRRRVLEAQRVASGEQLPFELRDASAWRTWVLITSPLCATCGPAEQRLRQADSGARIVTIDAHEQPALARRLRVKAAPTLLRTDRSGYVRDRVAGPEAVSRYLDLHEVAT